MRRRWHRARCRRRCPRRGFRGGSRSARRCRARRTRARSGSVCRWGSCSWPSSTTWSTTRPPRNGWEASTPVSRIATADAAAGVAGVLGLPAGRRRARCRSSAAGTGSSGVTLATVGDAMSRSTASASTVATTIGRVWAWAVTSPSVPISDVDGGLVAPDCVALRGARRDRELAFAAEGGRGANNHALGRDRGPRP